MDITILTDASHCSETKVGGYGYWIASQRGKQGGGGSFKGLVRDSTTAEAMAICNAVVIAHKLKLIRPEDTILVQTDSKGAIKAFTDQSHRIEVINNVVKTFIQFRKANKLVIIFKHVPAHTGKKAARYVANSMCDKRAKAGMRKARNRLRQNETTK